MNPAYTRELIDQYGRSSLIQASTLFSVGISRQSISRNLFIPDDRIDDCIFAGFYLRHIAEEQRRFEDSICEPV